APARYLCAHCQVHFCELCVASHPGGERTGKFCRRCSNECVALNIQIVPPADDKSNFFAAIPGAFVYPFQSATGILFVSFGTLLFGVLNFFLGLPLAGLLGMRIIVPGYIFLLGYTFAY